MHLDRRDSGCERVEPVRGRSRGEREGTEPRGPNNLFGPPSGAPRGEHGVGCDAERERKRGATRNAVRREPGRQESERQKRRRPPGRGAQVADTMCGSCDRPRRGRPPDRGRSARVRRRCPWWWASRSSPSDDTSARSGGTTERIHDGTPAKPMANRSSPRSRARVRSRARCSTAAGATDGDGARCASEGDPRWGAARAAGARPTSWFDVRSVSPRRSQTQLFSTLANISATCRPSGISDARRGPSRAPPACAARRR